GLVEQLVPVVVRVHERIRGTVTDVSVVPLAGNPVRLEDRDAPFERGRTRRAVGEVADAGRRRRGQLQRRDLVVAEAAEVDRVALPRRALHSEDLAEVVEALLGLGRQDLDVREMRQIEARLAQFRYPFSSSSRCSASRSASAMIVSDGLTESVRGITEPSPT